MIILNDKEFEDNILLPCNMKTEPQYIKLRKLEGNSQKKKLTIPESSSEEPLEHSEIDNSKNSFFSDSNICSKNKNNPDQNQNPEMNQKLYLTKNQKKFVKKSKIQLFKNP